MASRVPNEPLHFAKKDNSVTLNTSLLTAAATVCFLSACASADNPAGVGGTPGFQDPGAVVGTATGATGVGTATGTATGETATATGVGTATGATATGTATGVGTATGATGTATGVGTATGATGTATGTTGTATGTTGTATGTTGTATGTTGTATGTTGTATGTTGTATGTTGTATGTTGTATGTTGTATGTGTGTATYPHTVAPFQGVGGPTNVIAGGCYTSGAWKGIGYTWLGDTSVGSMNPGVVGDNMCAWGSLTGTGSVSAFGMSVNKECTDGALDNNWAATSTGVTYNIQNDSQTELRLQVKVGGTDYCVSLGSGAALSGTKLWTEFRTACYQGGGTYLGAAPTFDKIDVLAVGKAAAADVAFCIKSLGPN